MSKPDDPDNDDYSVVIVESPAPSQERAKPKPQAGPDTPKRDLWDLALDWFVAHGALPALTAITVAVFAIHAHICGIL